MKDAQGAPSARLFMGMANGMERCACRSRVSFMRGLVIRSMIGRVHAKSVSTPSPDE